MRRPFRKLLFLSVLAAAGICAALLGTHNASAFPPGVCHGTACTGSTTDSFGGDVCEPGASTYWEDSYIPAGVTDPRLAKFTVMPDPPCTGATVGAPTSDPWPASNTDPDGRPAGKKEAGKAIFRFRWTVTVPQGSKPVGTMNVAWTLDWTAASTSGGGGTTGTTTTTKQPCPTTGTFPPQCRYDLEMRISAPDMIVGSTPRQKFVIKLTIYNNGPASSLAIPVETLESPRFGPAYLTTGRSRIPLPVVKILPGCGGQNITPTCPLRGLKAHGEESLAFTVSWPTWAATRFSDARATKEDVSIMVKAFVNVELDRVGAVCRAEENNCDNNRASEDIAVR